MPRRRANGPRKKPIQARSQATVDAIVDAAARILVAGGYGAFSTNRVAARAGVSVGSLYQYFPNKEALLAELMTRHVQHLARGFEAAFAASHDAPLPTLIRALIDANVASHLVEPELHRVLSSEVPPLEQVDAGTAFARHATERVRAMLASRRDEITVDDLDLATYLIVRAVEATIHEAVVERPTDLASGAVAREVSRMLLGYLTVGGPIRTRARPTRSSPARAGSRPGSTTPRRRRS